MKPVLLSTVGEPVIEPIEALGHPATSSRFEVSLECSLPSFARVTLRHQPQQHRHVAHLLCAVAVSRGTFRDKPIGVIEDAITLHDVQVTVRTGLPIASATLEPQGVSVPIARQGDAVSFTVPRLDVHQMVALHHAH